MTEKEKNAPAMGASKSTESINDSGDEGHAEKSKQFSDMGNAERFIAQHGDSVLYCPESDFWFVYCGNRWALDNGTEVNRIAQATVRSIASEAGRKGLSTAEKDAIRCHALRSASKGRIAAMLEVAKWQLAVKATRFDPDPGLINCLNGTLDLRTMTLRAHQRRDLITKITGVPFDPKAKCPTWKACLSKLLGGKEMIDFLQRAFGYSLTGSITEQCFFVLYGPGANGKSRILETLREALADYAMHTTTSSLLQSRSHPIRNDLARLHTARFVSAVEVGAGKRLDETLIKQLTGGDQVTVRYLYQEYFEYKPQFKLFIAANHRPEIRGVDHGIWRRIVLIPFDRILRPEEIDKDLPAKLREELPGIFAWAVEGCRLWHERGLDIPESISRATQQYRADMDILENFIADRCRKREDKRVPVSDLYEEYKTWSLSACEDAVGKKVFGDLMRQKSYRQGKSGSTRYWEGLEVLQQS